MSQDLPELPANVVKAIAHLRDTAYSDGEAQEIEHTLATTEASTRLESSLREWAAQLQRVTPEEGTILRRRVKAQRRELRSLNRRLRIEMICGEATRYEAYWLREERAGRGDPSDTPRAHEILARWRKLADSIDAKPSVSSALPRQDLIEALCPAPKEEKP